MKVENFKHFDAHNTNRLKIVTVISACAFKTGGHVLLQGMSGNNF